LIFVYVDVVFDSQRKTAVGFFEEISIICASFDAQAFDVGSPVLDDLDLTSYWNIPKNES
jgi:hypothetical protein